MIQCNTDEDPERELVERGHRESAAVAGFYNESWTELVEPGITVIEQPVEEIGRTAMSLLVERLQTPTLPVRKVVLSGRCIERGSTGAAR